MALLASDDFNRADETPLAGNWTLDQANIANLATNAVAWVFASGASDVNNARWNALTWPADQWSQATQTNTGTSGNNGLAVRIQTTGRGAYHFAPRVSGNGGYLLERLNTDLSKTTVASAAGTGSANGDVLYMQIIGTSLDCRQNGVSRMTATDSTFASGAAGMSGFTSGDGCLTDNWSGGDFAEDAPSIDSVDALLAAHLQATLLNQSALLDSDSQPPVSSGLPVNLAATPTASVTGAAALGVRKPLAATATATVTGTAALSVGKPLAAATTATVTSAAALDVSKPLAAAASLSVTAAADLNVVPGGVNLAATPTVTVTGAAGLQVAKPLAAAATATVTGAAALDVGKPLAVDGALSITGSAALSVGKPLAASGTLTLTGAVELTNASDSARPLAATPTATITGTAELSVGKPLAAAPTASVTATAALSVAKPLAAQGAASIVGAANLVVVKALVPDSVDTTGAGGKKGGVRIPGPSRDLINPLPLGQARATQADAEAQAFAKQQALQLERRKAAIRRDDEDVMALVAALISEELID